MQVWSKRIVLFIAMLSETLRKAIEQSIDGSGTKKQDAFDWQKEEK